MKVLRLPSALLLCFLVLLPARPAAAENAPVSQRVIGGVAALAGVVTAVDSYVSLLAPWNDAAPSTVSSFELVVGPPVAITFGLIVGVPIAVVGIGTDMTVRAIHRRFFSERARLRARLPSALRRTFPSVVPSLRTATLTQWRAFLSTDAGRHWALDYESFVDRVLAEAGLPSESEAAAEPLPVRWLLAQSIAEAPEGERLARFTAAIRDRSAVVRDFAAQWARQETSRESIEEIARVLQCRGGRCTEHDGVRLSAASALIGRAGPEELWLTAVETALRDPHAPVRRTAALALQSRPDAITLAPLFRLALADDDERVRYIAAVIVQAEFPHLPLFLAAVGHRERVAAEPSMRVRVLLHQMTEERANYRYTLPSAPSAACATAVVGFLEREAPVERSPLLE